MALPGTSKRTTVTADVTTEIIATINNITKDPSLEGLVSTVLVGVLALGTWRPHHASFFRRTLKKKLRPRNPLLSGGGVTHNENIGDTTSKTPYREKIGMER